MALNRHLETLTLEVGIREPSPIKSFSLVVRNELVINIEDAYVHVVSQMCRGHCGTDGMVVGFITTYATSAYYHKSCEFESRS